MGDDFVTYGFPFVDLRSDGSVAGMIAAMEQATKQLPPNVKVIPGHGPLSTLEHVRRYVTMLKETLAAAQKGVKEEETLDHLKQENVLAPWQQWSGDFITTEQWLITVYND
jgi:cyclase